MDRFWENYESPIGLIEMGANESALTSLYFVDAPRTGTSSSPIIEVTIQQIDEYFADQRREFDLPLDLIGTKFQQRVWGWVMAQRVAVAARGLFVVVVLLRQLFLKLADDLTNLFRGDARLF